MRHVALALAAAFATTVPAHARETPRKTARADEKAGPGHIVSLRSRADLDASVVELIGDRPLSFTTLRLPAPPRVVLDFVDASFQGVAAELSVEDGTVRRVGAAAAGTRTARVVIELAGDAEFDVRASGNRLDVRVPRIAPLRPLLVASAAPTEPTLSPPPPAPPVREPPPAVSLAPAGDEPPAPRELVLARADPELVQERSELPPAPAELVPAGQAPPADKPPAIVGTVASPAEPVAVPAPRQTPAEEQQKAPAEPQMASAEKQKASPVLPPSIAAPTPPPPAPAREETRPVVVATAEAMPPPAPLPVAPPPPADAAAHAESDPAAAMAAAHAEQASAPPVEVEPPAPDEPEAPPEPRRQLSAAPPVQVEELAPPEAKPKLPTVALVGRGQLPPSRTEAPTPRPAAAPPPPTKRPRLLAAVKPHRSAINGIGFRPSAGGTVIVRSDHAVVYSVSAEEHAVLVDLPGATIPLRANRLPIDTSAFGGAVQRVLTKVIAGGVQLRVELRGRVEFDVQQHGNVLTVTFAPPG